MEQKPNNDDSMDGDIELHVPNGVGKTLAAAVFRPTAMPGAMVTSRRVRTRSVAKRGSVRRQMTSILTPTWEKDIPSWKYYRLRFQEEQQKQKRNGDRSKTSGV